MSDTVTTRRRAAETATTTTPETPAKPRAKRSQPDPEIRALAQLDRIMADLPPDAAMRCLDWLDARYSDYPNRQPEYNARRAGNIATGSARVTDPDFPHAGP